jgi:hypothetical protein
LVCQLTIARAITINNRIIVAFIFSPFASKRIIGLHESGGDQTSPPTLNGCADNNTVGGQVNFKVRKAMTRNQQIGVWLALTLLLALALYRWFNLP